jgi:hypothetical protein
MNALAPIVVTSGQSGNVALSTEQEALLRVQMRERHGMEFVGPPPF